MIRFIPLISINMNWYDELTEYLRYLTDMFWYGMGLLGIMIVTFCLTLYVLQPRALEWLLAELIAWGVGL